MFYASLACPVAAVLDLLTLRTKTTQDKDLEILVLRQQLRLLQRQTRGKPRASRLEKLLLAVLIVKLKALLHRGSQQLDPCLLVFKPDTVLKWHRELVQRKWTFRTQPRPGRPRVSPELEALVIRLAKENARWGTDRIQGELLKLGYRIGATTIRAILRRHRIPSAPIRATRSSSWGPLLKHYRQQLLACDFFTVETALLHTVYVLFFIEIGTRRVQLAECTTHPTSAWVTQQARHVMWSRSEQDTPFRFLIHDRDTKFSRAFDSVFVSEGITILRTPFRAPNANACAERWVRTVRQECLDHIIIFNEAHLRSVLREFVAHYNSERPHQGLQQQCPIPQTASPTGHTVRRRDRLGGIIHEYHREAA
jgi:putative transposase